MARLTPEEYAEKLARRLSASTEDIRKGVERVKESPTEGAARELDRALLGYSDAVSSGRMANRLRAVSLGEWKAQTLTKGLPRIASGAAAAKPKMAAFAREFFPVLDAIVAEVKAMPKTTLSDRINRATVYMQRTAEFKRGR